MAKTIAEPIYSFIQLPELVITAPRPNTAKAEKLVPFILDAEGGLSRSKIDLASANFCPTPNPEDGYKYHTNKGITYATWKEFMGPNRDLDFYRMTDWDWFYIFKKGYWDRWKADHIFSQQIANVLVDWVWASGVWGIRFPQRMLGVTEDGIVGKETLSALNQQNKDVMARRLYARREEHFRNLAANDPKFGAPNLQGWLNRLEDLKKFNERIKRE